MDTFSALYYRPPFLFNQLKHHRQVVLQLVEAIKNGLISMEEAEVCLQVVGHSMIDFYYGELSPITITTEVKNHLKSMNCMSQALYEERLHALPKPYMTVQLTDGSSWTLLMGREPGHYVHLHPSRGSTFTLRVRALTLKTAILLKASAGAGDLVQRANEIRKVVLRASPIKNLAHAKGLSRVLSVL